MKFEATDSARDFYRLYMQKKSEYGLSQLKTIAGKLSRGELTRDLHNKKVSFVKTVRVDESEKITICELYQEAIRLVENNLHQKIFSHEELATLNGISRDASGTININHTILYKTADDKRRKTPGYSTPKYISLPTRHIKLVLISSTILLIVIMNILSIDTDKAANDSVISDIAIKTISAIPDTENATDSKTPDIANTVDSISYNTTDTAELITHDKENTTDSLIRNIRSVIDSNKSSPLAVKHSILTANAESFPIEKLYGLWLQLPDLEDDRVRLYDFYQNSAYDKTILYDGLYNGLDYQFKSIGVSHQQLGEGTPITWRVNDEYNIAIELWTDVTEKGHRMKWDLNWEIISWKPEAKQLQISQIIVGTETKQMITLLKCQASVKKEIYPMHLCRILKK